jgi:hypothetical protein
MEKAVTVRTTDTEKITIHSQVREFDWKFSSDDLHKTIVDSGIIHREDGPAIIKEDISDPNNPKVVYTCWMDRGEEHRVDGPSTLLTDKDHYHEKWHREGSLQRSFAPAIIYATPNEIQLHHYHDGFRHRKGGPAYLKIKQSKDSSIEAELVFFINSHKHNGFGPSEYRFYNIKSEMYTTISWSKKGVSNVRSFENKTRSLLPLPVFISKRYNEIDQSTIYQFVFNKEDCGPLPYNMIVSFFKNGKKEFKYFVSYNDKAHGSIHKYIEENITEDLKEKYLYNLNNVEEDYYGIFGVDHLIADFEKAEGYIQQFLGELFDNKDFSGTYT